MRFPDSWSFHQKPSGAFKHLLRIPVYLFRWRLGFVLGERFVLISQTGRKSGRSYQSPVEVVEHDKATMSTSSAPEPGRTLTGTGTSRRLRRRCSRSETADGRRHSDSSIQTTRRNGSATTKPNIPAQPRQLLEMMGNSYDGTDEGRRSMLDRMPTIAFTALLTLVWVIGRGERVGVRVGA